MNGVNDARRLLQACFGVHCVQVELLNLRFGVVFRLAGGGALVSECGTGRVDRPQFRLAVQIARKQQSTAERPNLPHSVACNTLAQAALT